MTDLAKSRKDYAVFLPAISGFYTEILGRNKLFSDYLAKGRTPAGFNHGIEGLNFLDKDLGYYFYDRCLYSAGHAYLDLDRSEDMEDMIHYRDKSVVCVGDSGGFQIGKGVIKFDWKNFYEQKGDKGYKGDADKVRLKILNWLEFTADWAMTLDVPTWAAKNEKMRKITGLKDETDCLKATLFNLDFFMANRTKGKVKWLNVLQGTEWDDAQVWYEAVKGYDTEGWAMGGNNIRDMDMALRRIMTLRDDGLIQDRDWLHFLGTSRLDWAVMLTSIQRLIRKHINPNLTVSFDCASPFIATANGLVYTHNILTSERFSYVMDSCFDNKDFKDSDLPFPFDSTLGNKLTVGDICIYGKSHALIDGVKDYSMSEDDVIELTEAGCDAVWVPADLNKIKKVGKTSWDSISYTMLMAHNVEMHIRAVQRANQLTDVETIAQQPNWRRWFKVKRSDKSQELSKWVPRNILYFNSFIEELFVSDDWESMLNDAKEFLNDLSNNRHHSDQRNSTFSQLFDDSVQTEIEIEDDELKKEQLHILEVEIKGS